MSVEKTMYEEAQSEFKEAGKMKLGSEDHVKTIAAANATVDRLNEIEKIKVEKRKLDVEERKLDIEERKLEHDKKDRFIKNALTIGIFAASTIVTIWANYDSKKFEGAYTHTTEAGRGSERKLLNFMDKVRIF